MATRAILTDESENSTSLRLIILEDSVHDAELIERQVRKDGFNVIAWRIDTASTFADALANSECDIIIADYNLPGFGALPALEQLKQSKRDIPFIIVSGAITDEIAVESMRAGANDYVLKGNLARLAPAIRREMKEAVTRREKSQADAAVRNLSALVESSSDAIIGKSLDGVITSWNHGAERLYGYTATEILGRSISVLMPAHCSDEVAQILGRVGKGESIEQHETIRQRKDGTLVDVSVTISPVVNAAGNVTGAATVARDITERKLAEANRKAAERALRESEQRFRTVAENVPQMLWAADAEGNFIYLSPKWPAYTGTAPEENAHGGWADAIHPEDRPKAVAAWDEAVNKSEPYEIEYRLRRHDGEYRWHLSGAVPVQDVGREAVYWFGTTTDIHDQKRAQEVLIRNEKLASVGRMAATVAHEINNPLASAINAVFLASLDRSASDSVRSRLEVAEAELERVAHITKQTLGFYRETGKPTAVNLSEVADGTLLLYEPKLRNKSVSVHRNLRCTVPARAIEGELRQVISNLIANSIDAMNGEGVLQVRASGPTRMGGHSMVRLTVADNGEGISPQNLTRVFEPFFTTRESIGTGLGLWVAKELVQKHGGRIRVRSQVGKGTVFSIWLPAERRQRAREQEAVIPGSVEPHHWNQTRREATSEGRRA